MRESQIPESDHSSPTLFCVMGESLYDELENCLAPQQSVTSLYDMRELVVISRQTGNTVRQFDIREIADLYLQRIRKRQPTGPYRIAGFSAGGAVAFEIAQRLLRDGEAPPLVVLFDTPAVSGLRKRGWFERQMIRLAGLRTKRLGSVYQFLRRMVSRIRYRPAAISTRAKSRRMSHEELIELRREFYRHALIRYETKAYPGNVIVFKAQIAERPGEYVCDEWLGWKDLIRGELQVHELPCDHMGIMGQPCVQKVAEEILAFTGSPAKDDHVSNCESSLGQTAGSQFAGGTAE